MGSQCLETFRADIEGQRGFKCAFDAAEAFGHQGRCFHRQKNVAVAGQRALAPFGVKLAVENLWWTICHENSPIPISGLI